MAKIEPNFNLRGNVFNEIVRLPSRMKACELSHRYLKSLL